MPGPNSSCDRKFLSFPDRFHSTPAAALTFSLLVSPGFRVLPEDEEGCKSTRHFQLFFLECHSLSEPEFRVVEKFLLFPSNAGKLVSDEIINNLIEKKISFKKIKKKIIF